MMRTTKDKQQTSRTCRRRPFSTPDFSDDEFFCEMEERETPANDNDGQFVTVGLDDEMDNNGSWESNGSWDYDNKSCQSSDDGFVFDLQSGSRVSIQECVVSPLVCSPSSSLQLTPTTSEDEEGPGFKTKQPRVSFTAPQNKLWYQTWRSVFR